MRVAVAIILDDQGRVLITQRSKQVDHGGFWEFPGGKLEEDEPSAEALVREIKEEVGLLVLSYYFLGEIIHHYAEKTVQLMVYVIENYEGKAQCCESQLDLRWVGLADLNNFTFPAANSRVIELVRNSSGGERLLHAKRLSATKVQAEEDGFTQNVQI